MLFILCAIEGKGWLCCEYILASEVLYYIVPARGVACAIHVISLSNQTSLDVVPLITLSLMKARCSIVVSGEKSSYY